MTLRDGVGESSIFFPSISLSLAGDALSSVDLVE